MLFKAEVKPQMPSFRSARAEGNSKELSQVKKKKKPLKLSSQWRLPEAGEILEVREDGGNAARRSWRLAGSSVGPFDAHIQVARQQWKQWKLKPMSAGGGTYLQEVRRSFITTTVRELRIIAMTPMISK